jgi:hypothetical protein
LRTITSRGIRRQCLLSQDPAKNGRSFAIRTEFNVFFARDFHRKEAKNDRPHKRGNLLARAAPQAPAAYRTGAEAAHKYPGKGFLEIEDDVVLDYQRHRIGAALPWDHARHAIHAAWAKLSYDIGSRDFGRGIRSGF